MLEILLGPWYFPESKDQNRSREPDWTPFFTVEQHSLVLLCSLKVVMFLRIMERKDWQKTPKPRHPISHVFLETTGRILSEVMIIERSVILIDILLVLTSGCPLINISVLTLLCSVLVLRCKWVLFKGNWSLKENSATTENRNPSV